MFIKAGVTVKSTEGVIIKATDNVIIHGTLDANGTAGANSGSYGTDKGGAGGYFGGGGGGDICLIANTIINNGSVTNEGGERGNISTATAGQAGRILIKQLGVL